MNFKLSDAAIADVLRRYQHTNDPLKAIAYDHKISTQTLGRIVNAAGIPHRQPQKGPQKRLAIKA